MPQKTSTSPLVANHGKTDTSELVWLLRNLETVIDNMQSVLGSFAEGTTSELTGERTRLRLRDILGEAVEIRWQIEAFCRREERPLRGRVTRRMAAAVSDAQEQQDALRDVLQRVISDPAHNFTSSEREDIQLLLHAARYRLQEVADSMQGPSGVTLMPFRRRG